MSELVRYESLAGGIARVTLDRPDRRNAILVPEMLDELAAALGRAQDDDTIKVIVLAGAGEHFCSGDDVRRTPIDAAGGGRRGRVPQSARMRYTGRHEQLIDQLVLESNTTVVVACQGAVLGLGFRLAMSADLIVAADDAYFGRPQSRLGLAGLDMLLPVTLLRLGINRGYEAIITGRSIPVAELADWGVVSSVVPRDRLDDEALRYARAIAAHSTDGLMLGRQAMRMFWQLAGLGQWSAFTRVAHPLFTNLVWRDDEANFLKAREQSGSAREALDSIYQRWRDLGF